MNNRMDYKQLVGEANSYNKQLAQDRRQRLPFIDAQTGVAQSDCSLWNDEKDRHLATGGRLYSYPVHRWHKRRREYLMRWSAHERISDTNQQKEDQHGREIEDYEEFGQHQRHLIERAASSSSSYSSGGIQSSNQPNGASSSLPSRESCSRSLLSSGTSQKQNPSPHRPVANNYQHNQQPPPSRADSTGSHSFVDSDSRDQSSSATSQSLSGDSPQSHHQLDDEQVSNIYLGELVTPSNQHGDGSQDDEHAHYQGETMDSLELRKQHNLKAALERVSIVASHCKKGSAGRKSKSRSILSKNNGHKTTHDNNSEVKLTTESTSCNGSLEHQSPPTSLRLVPPNTRIHVCPICDQTYKTRPGLSYHFLHVHDAILPKQNKSPTEKQQSNKPPENGNKRASDHHQPMRESGGKKSRTLSQEAPSTRVLRNNRAAHIESVQISSSGEGEQVVLNDGAIVGDCISPDLIKSDISKSNDTIIVSEQEDLTKTVEPTHTILIDGHTKEAISGCEPNGNTTTIIASNESKQNLFCDFCLGTTEKNRRTRQPEELISCSNCGSSGHPSCLQFSDNIRQSVLRYNWQCIDCKTCSTCGKADHEDQLLFCDDCDRSYHTFCLSPRLENLPEGNWTCKLCLSYFYNK